MKEQLYAVKERAKEALAQATTSEELEAVRVRFAGKKGELTALLSQMGKLSPDQRPIIGQIACLIMAFAPKNKNIKHFARAQLIWMVIAIVLIGILVALLSVLTNTLMDFIKESTGGEFSNWGDIFSNLGDLEGLTEQFQNGGLEGLPIE